MPRQRFDPAVRPDVVKTCPVPKLIPARHETHNFENPPVIGGRGAV